MSDKPTLAERLAAVAGEVESLAKDGTMEAGKERYKYASVNAIADAARPLLFKHGVALVPGPVEVLSHDEVESKYGTKGYHVVVRRSWTIAANGEELYAQSVGASIDYSDKAYNKAHTYARKNLLVDLLNLSTEEDPDSERPEVARAPARQAPPPRPAPAKRQEQKNYEDVVRMGKADGMSLNSIHDTLKALGYTVPSDLDDPAHFEKAKEAIQGAVGSDNKGGLPDKVEVPKKGKKKTDAQVADELLDEVFDAEPEGVEV